MLLGDGSDVYRIFVRQMNLLCLSDVTSQLEPYYLKLCTSNCQLRTGHPERPKGYSVHNELGFSYLFYTISKLFGIPVLSSNSLFVILTLQKMMVGWYYTPILVIISSLYRIKFQILLVNLVHYLDLIDHPHSS